MYKLQQTEFVLSILGIGIAGCNIGDVDVGTCTDNEEEGCVASVDCFVASVFDEGALEFGAGEALTDDFGFESYAFFHGEPLVVFGTAGLTLFVTIVYFYVHLHVYVYVYVDFDVVLSDVLSE